jgi:electron transfer flavoprotein beta subunit
MNIIALIKQAPDTTQLSGTVNGLQLLAEDGARVLNPWDEYALETALQLVETHGGSVTALSMGNPIAAEALRTCIAMGAAEAILVSDPALAQADSLATAIVLAAAVKKIGRFDLIIGGRSGIEGATAATAVQVAALLDIPQISYVAAIKSIDPAAKTLRATRLLESGRQTVSTTLPALLTVVKEIATPRFPSFIGLRKAKKADIPTWTLADISLSAASITPRLSWQLSLPPSRQTKLHLFTDPAELAQQILTIINDQ